LNICVVRPGQLYDDLPGLALGYNGQGRLNVLLAALLCIGRQLAKKVKNGKLQKEAAMTP
jgi:hypothetical protein